MEATHAEPCAGLVDGDGRIAGDLLCIHCGYNLRTLLEDGVCPECGRAVRASIIQTSTRECKWLGRTAEAVTALACILSLLACLAGLAILSAATEPAALAGLACAAMPTVAAIAIVLVRLTYRDPLHGTVPEGLSARRGVRLLLLIIPAVLLLNYASFEMRHGIVRGIGTSRRFPDLIDILPAVGWLVWLALLAIAVLRHVAGLVKRIGRPDLAEKARDCSTITLGAAALLAVCAVWGSRAAAVLAGCALIAVGVPVVVLLFRAGWALEGARQQASGVAGEVPADA